MACSCQTKTSPMYSDTDFSLNHCATCKHVHIANDYQCDRFHSVVTGKPAMVECGIARADESLCGFYGRCYENK